MDLSSRGLSFKLLFLIAGVSLIGVLASSALVLTLQREQLIDSALVASTRVSSAVSSNLEHAMLRNDQEMLRQIVRGMVDKESVEHIRILDAQGMVHVSSLPGESGRRFDQTEPICQSCHYKGIMAGTPTTILTSNADHDALLNVNVIRNERQCQGCHDPLIKTLGITLIELSLSDLNNQLGAAVWRIAFAALATLTLLVGLMSFALRRLILQPVGELNQGMTEIRAGNLDYLLHVTAHDELSQLGKSFDAMRRQLKASQIEMERRNQELALLNDFSVGASQLLDLQQILEFVIDTVVNGFGTQAGSVYLIDDETGQLTLRACRGISKQQCAEVARCQQAASRVLAQETAQVSHEISIVNLATVARWHGLWEDAERRSYVNVPLKAKGTVIAVLGLVTRPGEPLTERELRVLEAIGHGAGIAIDNALLLTETRRREEETTTLYRLMLQISASLEMQQVLDAIAEGARQILDADIGFVGLIDEGQDQLCVRACVGTQTEGVKGLRIPIGDLLPSNAAPDLKPMSIEEWTSTLSIPHAADLIAKEGVASSLVAPMWRSRHLRGFVGVMTRQQRHFSKEDAELFTRLALQVVVAIENAELYRQVRYLATLEERDRLAREMHDNLAQMLGYMNVKIAITDDLLTKNETPQARSSLQELKQITKEAYTDVRDSIFGLRTPSSAHWGLVPMLEEYIAEYREHCGIDARLTVDDERLTEFPDEVQVQLNRIIQEALTNVRKHSGASRAWIRFEQEDHLVRISIADNGHGFEPAQLTADGSRHFGLQIMRERAESVGGELSIDSQKGAGTRVVLHVPIMAAD